MSYEIRLAALIVMPERGGRLFDETATRVSIEDEAGGEFIVIEQEAGKIRIDPDEWAKIREAVDRMVGECR